MMGAVALSTMWMSPLGYDPGLAPARAAREILRRAEQVGAEALELDYRLSREVLKALGAELRREGVVVTSLHAPLPIPEGLAEPTAEPFNPASTDAEERALATRHICLSLEWAHELEAAAVVLHLGSIPEVAEKHITKAAARGEPGAGQRLEQLMHRRRQLARVHLDMASFCLEKLIKRAEQLGLALGLENRYHFFEIPLLDELKLLLERFEGAPVGLWYDAGHGYVQSLAGITPWQEWLTGLGGQLVGCHLHDALGPQDHRPPATGEMPWEELGPLVAGAGLKVVEVTSEHPPEQLATALEFVRSLGDKAMEQAR